MRCVGHSDSALRITATTAWICDFWPAVKQKMALGFAPPNPLAYQLLDTKPGKTTNVEMFELA